MIELLGREGGAGSGRVICVQIDSQSFIDTGTNGVVYAESAASATAKSVIIHNGSDTTFDLAQDSGSPAVLTRITGLFPKNP